MSSALSAPRGRYRLLLGSLVAVLVAAPVIAELGLPYALFEFVSILVYGAAVVSLHFNRRLFLGAIVFVAGLGVLRFLVTWVGQEGFRIGFHAAIGLFFIYTLVVVAVRVLRVRRVDVDTIYGAAAVYLLLGVVFGYLFAVVVAIDPMALTLSAEDIEVLREGDISPLVYFSFVTLTTLGYGDIQPVAPLARTLAWSEAVIGQLFVAVTLARMVSLMTADASRSESP